MIDVHCERRQFLKLLESNVTVHMDELGIPDLSYKLGIPEEVKKIPKIGKYVKNVVQNAEETENAEPKSLNLFEFLTWYIDTANSEVYFNQQKIKAHNFDKEDCRFFTFAPVINISTAKMTYCYAAFCDIRADEEQFYLYDVIDAVKTGIFTANRTGDHFKKLIDSNQSIRLCKNYLTNPNKNLYDFFLDDPYKKFY